jgi:ribulose-5-phosphate 4-epimerase/fuculose-1-phosphate aldolase
MTATAAGDIGASLKGRVDDNEWDMRVQLAAAYRLADLHGWTTSLIYNHISARIPGKADQFLLNPFGLRYDEVTASNLVKIDLDGNILDDTPYGINQAGYVIHGAIHGARDDVVCALHTHTEAGMAVSALADGLMFTNQEVLRFYDDTAYHDFEGIAFDTDECARLVADLGGNSAMILRNHGLLTVGHSVGEAFVLMYYLEKCCASQLRLMASGGTITQPSREVCAHTARQYRALNDLTERREWPALMRMADDADPSFRD